MSRITCQCCGETNHDSLATRCWECGHELVQIAYTAPVAKKSQEEIFAELDAKYDAESMRLVKIVVKKLETMDHHKVSEQIKSVCKANGYAFAKTFVAALNEAAATGSDTFRAMMRYNKFC